MTEEIENRKKYIRLDYRLCWLTLKQAEEAKELGIEDPIADTIEELCDERVVTSYYANLHLTRHEIVPKSSWDTVAVLISDNLAKGITDCNYYGAIWTDKGLLYVAKLNEKGKLELI